MPLYPPFMQNGGHLQSNTSISQTKRRRAIDFDSMSRFCGAWISEKVLPNTPCHCIHHFGGDLKKMAAISKVVRLFEKLRDTEPSISTLCLGSVGCRLEEKVLCSICQYWVSTILTLMAAILQNGSHFHE